MTMPVAPQEFRAEIARLEAAQMALPRGPEIWPNQPIDEIAQQADDIIAAAPPELREELIDMFTWGLGEI